MFHWRRLALEDGEVAALGAAVGGDLLVGQHGAQAGAPVDRRLGGVRQPVARRAPRRARRRSAPPRRGRPASARSPDANCATSSSIGRALLRVRVVPGVEDLQEDPLGPPVVVRVDRGERAALVVAQAQPAQLAAVCARCWPRWRPAGGCRSARRTARRAGRRRRSPGCAGRCGRSCAGSGRRRRWRCSPAGGRRAGPRRTGTGTCP